MSHERARSGKASRTQLGTSLGSRSACRDALTRVGGMSASGTKRTFACVAIESAFDP